MISVSSLLNLMLQPRSHGGASTHHMPIQSRGTAPNLPGDLDGRHGTGCQRAFAALT